MSLNRRDALCAAAALCTGCSQSSFDSTQHEVATETEAVLRNSELRAPEHLTAETVRGEWKALYERSSGAIMFLHIRPDAQHESVMLYPNCDVTSMAVSNDGNLAVLSPCAIVCWKQGRDKRTIMADKKGSFDPSGEVSFEGPLLVYTAPDATKRKWNMASGTEVKGE